MTNASMPNGEQPPESGTVIKVIGVGGAGGNAIQHMIEKGMTGVEFIAANTDAQALTQSTAHNVMQIGDSGLGAGMKPELGRELAEASVERIAEAIKGAHMVFIAAGMGGGTGTGAAPVVAEVAKKQGALTVAVVSKPFSYEGDKCMEVAERGLEELSKNVDSIIIILNEKLEEMYEDESLLDWLRHADDVLYNAVAGIAEIINIPGHINVDFNDVKTVMGAQGKAMMGVATATGEDRARVAAEKAIASPLLDGLDLSGARGVLVNITGSRGVKGREIKEVMNTVRSFAASDAEIAQGVAYDESMGDTIRVTVVATGLGRTKKPVQMMAQTPRAKADEHVRLTAPSAGRDTNVTPLPGVPQAAAPAASSGRPPSVWRREKPAEAVRGMEKDGMDKYDIPAFLRNNSK